MTTKLMWVLLTQLTTGDMTSPHADRTECAHAAAHMREVNIQAGTYVSVSCHAIHAPVIPQPANAPIPELPATAP